MLMTNEKQFYSIQEIMQILGVSDEGVRRLIISGKLQAIRVGRQWRVYAWSFEDFIRPASSELHPEQGETHDEK